VRGLRGEQKNKRNIFSSALADLPCAGELVDSLFGVVA